jgi:RNA polymerase sigma-70 factor, ECF subfamily
MSEDRQLIRRLRLGDREALRAIYEKYSGALFASALCLVGDRASAEDCLHDVFVAFAAGAPQLDGGANLKGYLVACIVNRAKDVLRRKGREAAAVDLGAAPEAASDAAGPAALAEGRDESRRAFDAMSRLPYEQRETVLLHLQGGMTFREIAHSQKVSTNTVLSRYRYGIEKLRAILSPGAGR